MKTMRLLSTTILLALMSMVVLGQNKKMQYFRYPDQTGINVFETSKTQVEEEEQVEETFDGLKVRVGGNYSILFQGLSQENDFGGDVNVPDELVNLTNNFTLPSANLNLDIQLEDGVRMHIRTYLSSRHHNEAWVKGGYFQIDKLDFIKDGFLSGFMEVATIRFGMDDINYGDAHFRRSDNSASIFNPFVGNYIMDAFTTEPFGELTIQKSGFLGVIGLSNGKLNQSPLEGDDGFVFYTKLGYDKQMNDDLRVRFTGSLYSSNDRSTRDYLYNGDRAGARYYNVLEGQNDARVSDFLPRFNSGFGYQTAIQFNPFVKFKGFEFFGIVEVTNNGDDAVGGSYTQLGGEAIYRFGGREQLFVGARLNSVQGEASDVALTNEINRTNIGGGWFMTKNVLAKVEYVTHSYGGEGFDATKFQGAKFDGIAIEAVISF